LCNAQHIDLLRSFAGWWCHPSAHHDRLFRRCAHTGSVCPPAPQRHRRLQVTGLVFS
jgi:hypothetical protein